MPIPVFIKPLLELLPKIIHSLWVRVMKLFFSENRLAGDVAVGLGNLEPGCSVSINRISAFNVSVGNESVIDVDVMQLDGKITADGVEIYVSTITPKPSERLLKSKHDRLFEFRAGELTQQGRDKIASVRHGVLPYTDYLEAVLTITSTGKTKYREFAATRELPIRIRVTN